MVPIASRLPAEEAGHPGSNENRRSAPVPPLAPEISDIAVGFSRQPLPKGNRFAIVTNTEGPGIKATDATIRSGLELAKLRPETLGPVQAKLPPTATFSAPASDRIIAAAPHISTAGGARAGYNKITNGVKQKLPGTCLRGGGSSALSSLARGPS